MCAAKTKVLISCADTAQLICVFVFAYGNIRFSHDAAQFRVLINSKFGLFLSNFLILIQSF